MVYVGERRGSVPPDGRSRAPEGNINEGRGVERPVIKITLYKYHESLRVMLLEETEYMP